MGNGKTPKHMRKFRVGGEGGGITRHGHEDRTSGGG
jgi:hypothetical protein